MSETTSTSNLQKVLTCVLLAVGIAVFAVRLLHDGPYAMPSGGPLFGGLGALLLGAVLLWSAVPRALGRLALGRLALLASPVVLEDRATVRAIHALKVEKYAVARGAAAIGLYPREARDTAVSLRLDPCPGG